MLRDDEHDGAPPRVFVDLDAGRAVITHNTFAVNRWIGAPPDPDVLRAGHEVASLKASCHLWTCLREVDMLREGPLKANHR
jgi:hypothetical protein